MKDRVVTSRRHGSRSALGRRVPFVALAAVGATSVWAGVAGEPGPARAPWSAHSTAAPSPTVLAGVEPTRLTTKTAPPPAPGAPAPSATTGSNIFTHAQRLSGLTGTWVAYGATLAWVTTPTNGGGGSMAVTSTGTSAPLIASGSPQAGGLTPVTPGNVYEGRAQIQAAGSSVVVQPVIGFYSPSGSITDLVWGPNVTVGTSGWTAMPYVAAVAPPGSSGLALGFVVNTSATGQMVDVASAVLASTPGGSPAVNGPLHTSGNAILDANGHRVVLRGVNAVGLEQSSSPPVLDQNQIVQVKAWGANMVRIPLGEQLWLTSSCQYDASYQNAVDEMVNWVTSLGMVALLELNWGSVDCSQPGPIPMPNAPSALQFWQQVASRYGSNPLVAFELYNEPFGISDAVWLSGGTITSNGVTYQAAGMQQLYDAVRSSGATNLVVVGGNNYATTVPPQLVQGTNVAYAVHSYTCPDNVPPACTTPNPYDPSPILTPWVSFGAAHPVLLTEFGWPSPYDGTYNSAVIKFAVSQSWGWSAYVWDGLNSSPWSLLAQIPSSGPFEPMPSGMPVLAGLVGLPQS